MKNFDFTKSEIMLIVYCLFKVVTFFQALMKPETADQMNIIVKKFEQFITREVEENE